MNRLLHILGGAVLTTTFFLAGCASPRTVAQRLADAERAGVCPVHRQTLEAQRVPISYGLVMGVPEGLREWEMDHFPFARREILGGCLVVIDEERPERSSPVFADVLVCTICDEAKADWLRQHPLHPWTQWWREATPEDSTAPPKKDRPAEARAIATNNRLKN
ncbi:MAG TPA: hypothetical protein VHF69_07965 [Candidatus Synoicihabitans sp.]|nr:hypothetical protein [Candidatus Synoicihabitans sp.]